ncbi:IcmT/TraK family protein [Microbulbifer epialgicus]|uniref:IcmT/TraK family protein n=1 Tax=Microbulbifer epialgicus TaxID=393907 RepID=A0ABV4NTE4_9GAMM
MKFYEYTQWRNTGLAARLGLVIASIDARAFVFIFIFILHISWETLYTFLGIVTFFGLLEYLGYSVPVAIRKARSLIAGRRRFVQRTISRRRRIIHG